MCVCVCVCVCVCGGGGGVSFNSRPEMPVGIGTRSYEVLSAHKFALLKKQKISRLRFLEDFSISIYKADEQKSYNARFTHAHYSSAADIQFLLKYKQL